MTTTLHLQSAERTLCANQRHAAILPMCPAEYNQSRRPAEQVCATSLAKAQCTTLRLKLLKIGALMRITVRKVWVSLASGYPYQELFRQVYAQLRATPLHC